MASSDPATLLSNRRGFRLRAASLVATWMILFAFRAMTHDAATDALINGLQLLILTILGGGSVYIVETQSRGRARWRGRVAALAGISGGLLLCVVWGLSWSAWVMGGIFWLGLCALTIAWMLLRVDVPD